MAGLPNLDGFDRETILGGQDLTHKDFLQGGGDAQFARQLLEQPEGGTTCKEATAQDFPPTPTPSHRDGLLQFWVWLRGHSGIAGHKETPGAHSLCATVQILSVLLPPWGLLSRQASWAMQCSLLLLPSVHK